MLWIISAAFPWVVGIMHTVVDATSTDTSITLATKESPMPTHSNNDNDDEVGEMLYICSILGKLFSSLSMLILGIGLLTAFFQ